MGTLSELIHYCNEPNPVGALMLTGEWGCGKTYLIETDLADALRETHIIVRVSLFGINSIDSLHDTVKKQWFYCCSPTLGKIQKNRERLDHDKGAITAVSDILKTINPLVGHVADAMVAVNPLDFIPIQPTIEDIKTHEKKKVILVFDDLERSRLDRVELLGAINEYCENKDFNTIIVANEEYIIVSMDGSVISYNLLKEKIVGTTVLFTPYFDDIVHGIITGRTWQSQKYADFLSEKENLVLEVFESDPSLSDEEREKLDKFHNIRSLIGGLQSFHRIFYHMDRRGITDIDNYLYSYLAYQLVVKSGIIKDGKTCSTFTDDDIKKLYPRFSEKYLFPCVRRWVLYGDWNEVRFAKELDKIAPLPPEPEGDSKGIESEEAAGDASNAEAVSEASESTASTAEAVSEAGESIASTADTGSVQKTV